MSQVINFAKLQSTGNDFIMIDCNDNHIDSLDKEHIIKMCDRRFGIGADGLILVKLTGKTNIDMTYYNADGSTTAVCGNGLRAVAQFARVMGMVKTEDFLMITAGDGPHEAFFEKTGDVTVEIFADSPIEKIDRERVKLPDHFSSAVYTDTGVPHLILETDELNAIDVKNIGRKIRSHSYFEPDGTNVNFMQILPNDKISVRTYERGIEGETLSCGTGVVAAVLARWDSISATPDLDVNVPGGALKVYNKNNKIYLSGPSSIEFVGQYLVH